jgi:polysaccharide biosynthesis transport protein
MLERVDNRKSAGFDVDSPLGFIGPGDILRAASTLLRRQWSVVAGVTALAILAGLLYCLFAKPQYSSTALLIIDTKSTQLSEAQQTPVDTGKDTAFVDSEVEVLKSEQIALKVIDDLKLDNESEFQRPGYVESLLRAVLPASVVPADIGPTDYERVRRAVGFFKNKLDIRRVGLSFVIEVAFVSEDPKRAALVANAVSEAYISDQLESKFQVTQRAGTWLQQRLAELRDQAQKADREAQTFKAEKGIVDTQKGLIDEQQLAELNTRLLDAKAKTSEAQSKADRIQKIISEDVPDGSVADEFNNDVITNLRGQYSLLARKEDDLARRFGSNHEAAVKLRGEMTQVRDTIKGELTRLAQSYTSNLDIAKSDELAISTALNGLVKKSSSTNMEMVKLRELESVSQSYRTLYENFLQRYMNSVQQQSFPISEARVITKASPPIDPSWPKRGLVLLASSLLGLLAGAAAAMARDQLDNVFRTPHQVEEQLGIRCLGILTHISGPQGPGEKGTKRARPISGRQAAVEIMGLRDGPPTTKPPSFISHVVKAPFSQYSETLRGLKVALDLANSKNSMQVIGVSSALAREGKSTTILNLALLYGQAGKRVALVDADLRSPSLTTWLAPRSENGLIQALSSETLGEELMLSAADNVFDFLPAGLKSRIANTADIVGSAKMAELIAALRTRYDIVLIDLPPIVPVSDVAAVSHQLDGIVLVAAWGRTPVPIVKEALASNPSIQERVTGLLLSDASAKGLSRYNSMSAQGRYYGYGLDTRARF